MNQGKLTIVPNIEAMNRLTVFQPPDIGQIVANSGSKAHNEMTAKIPRSRNTLSHEDILPGGT